MTLLNSRQKRKKQITISDENHKLRKELLQFIFSYLVKMKEKEKEKNGITKLTKTENTSN